MHHTLFLPITKKWSLAFRLNRIECFVSGSCSGLLNGGICDVSNFDARQWVAVEDLLDTGKWEIVYNLQTADYHTYFVRIRIGLQRMVA